MIPVRPAAAVAPLTPARAGDGALRINPATQTVAPGATFTVQVMQTSSAPSMGVQFDLAFDPALVEPVSADLAPAYQGGMSILGKAPAVGPQAFAAAATSGVLSNVSAFFLPGAGGPVTPGEKAAITITMRAKTGSGTSKLTLQDAFLLNEQGDQVDATTTPGEVVVGAGGPASAGPAAGVPSVPGVTNQQVPSTAPSSQLPPANTPPIGVGQASGNVVVPPNTVPATGTPLPGAAVPPAAGGVPVNPTGGPGVDFAPQPLAGGGATPGFVSSSPPGLRLAPDLWKVDPGDTFTVHVVQTANAATRITQFKVAFKKSVLKLLDIERGPAFGIGGPPMDQQVQQANESGVVRDLLLTAAGTIPPGDAVAAVLTFQAIASGTAQVELSNGVIMDATTSAPLQSPDQQARVSVSGLAFDEWPWLWIVFGSVSAGVSGFSAFYRFTRRPLPWGLGERLRQWPRFTAMTFGLVPLGLMGYLVGTVVWNGLAAMTQVPLSELLSTEFRSMFSSGGSGEGGGAFGLLPAIWGSVMQVSLAFALAFPASLALAVCASEGGNGSVAATIRLALGVLSGVPPIVYALGAISFVEVIMIPKFSAGMVFSNFDPAKIGASTWPPTDMPWNAGALPWDLTGRDNSLLLGAVLLALLITPFMAPLIDDALRNVSQDMRDASHALGANRWYTLRHVTLPFAFPGIVQAAVLGTLKGLGDLMIAAFVIGWVPTMPNPLFDGLERAAPLTSVGAGLMGGFGFGDPGDKPFLVGNFAALVLLTMAVGLLAVAGRLRRQAVH